MLGLPGSKLPEAREELYRMHLKSYWQCLCVIRCFRRDKSRLPHVTYELTHQR